MEILGLLAGLALLAPVAMRCGGRLGWLALALVATTPAWLLGAFSGSTAPTAFVLGAGTVLALHLGQERLGRWAWVPSGVAALVLGSWSGAALPAHGMDAAAHLFASRRGVIFWNPALWLAAAGTVILFFGPMRGLAVASGTAGGLLALAGAESAVLPFATPGIAAALAALERRAGRRPAEVLFAAGAFLAAWNLLFMEQYRRNWIPRDDTIAFPEVAENNARLISAALGAPMAWPGPWLLATAYGLPLADFDRVVGHRAFTAGVAVLSLGETGATERLLGDGWSAPTTCGTALCRGVRERAGIWLPAPRAARVEMTVRVSGRGTLDLSVNGRPVGALPLSEDMADLRVQTPAEVWRHLNLVELRIGGGEAAVERVTWRLMDTAAP